MDENVKVRAVVHREDAQGALCLARQQVDLSYAAPMCSEHQSTSLQDSAKKAEPFAGLQGNRARQELETKTDKNSNRRKPRINRGHQP